MTSIYNGIKKVDVSKIIGPPLNDKFMLPIIKSTTNDKGFLDEKTEIHNKLTNLRKQYDDMKS